MTCSRLGVGMVYCNAAWILSRRSVGNRKWQTHQITSWKPSILSRPLSICSKWMYTKKWTAQVISGLSPISKIFKVSRNGSQLKTGFMKPSGWVTDTHLYSGFTGDYPYPHAHTLYFLETTERQYRLHPAQFRAKMIMFTFGNALARAYKLYGVRIYRKTHFNMMKTLVFNSCAWILIKVLFYTLYLCQTSPQSVLDHPITVQAVGTNGRIFQFLVFQLNTTDLSGDDGIKNQVGVMSSSVLLLFFLLMSCVCLYH